jgi:hypothetical protein
VLTGEERREVGGREDEGVAEPLHSLEYDGRV